MRIVVQVEGDMKLDWKERNLLRTETCDERGLKRMLNKYDNRCVQHCLASSSSRSFVKSCFQMLLFLLLNLQGKTKYLAFNP